MPRDLFGDVTRPSISIGNRKWYTVPLSLASHSAIVLMLIALPILAPAVMPSVFADAELIHIVDLVPPTPPLPPRPKLIEVVEHPPISSAAPTVAPTGFSPEKPVPDAGWETAKPVDLIFGEFNPNAIAPPPPVAKPAQAAPVRVGLGVRPPQKTYNVDPVYPPIAQAARVQGVVIIEATINEAGHVINARILRSVPLLDQSALEAVRQWQFTPSLVNGAAVPVIMTVTVNFMLNR